MNPPHTISLEPLKQHTLAILGYGNQGRAQALNLRDSGFTVLIGSQKGKGWETAQADGWQPMSLEDAAQAATLVVLLLPDPAIAKLYPRLFSGNARKIVGFAHSYALVFGNLSQDPTCSHFCVAPKGAGALLRKGFQAGGGLPAAFAIDPKAPHPQIREVTLAYAKAIGCASSLLLETTFRKEAEGDLFGEQAVLLGGMLELLRASFDVLTAHGHDSRLAFLDTVFEAKLILEVLLEGGPSALASRVSPAALYGGYTRGKRIIESQCRDVLEKMFQEVADGTFARELEKETELGLPTCNKAKAEWAASPLERAYQALRSSSSPTV